MQHAVALFRAQRVQGMKLQMDALTSEQLTATVISESGACETHTRQYHISTVLKQDPKDALSDFSRTAEVRLVMQLTNASSAGLEKEFKIACTTTTVVHANVDRAALPTTVIAAARELTRLVPFLNSQQLTAGSAHNALKVSHYA